MSGSPALLVGRVIGSRVTAKDSSILANYSGVCGQNQRMSQAKHPGVSPEARVARYLEVYARHWASSRNDPAVSLPEVVIKLVHIGIHGRID